MFAFNRSYFWTILAIFLPLLVISPRAGAQSSAHQTVLKGARLIDGTGRPAIENSVLIVEGDHVVAAEKRELCASPKMPT